jgi:galactokinase
VSVSTDQLCDRDEIRRLIPAGARVEDRTTSFERLGVWCRDNSLEIGAAFFVPGRIEVLGKHTDYAGGRSLLCAVGHGFSSVVVRDESDDVMITNLDSRETDSFRMHPDTRGEPGGWSNYPRVVARRLAHNFGLDGGGQIIFTSDLPIAAGISSSSALVVSVYLGLAWLNRLADRPTFRRTVASAESLADYLGCVENGRDYPGLPGTAGVGTTGGSQDHTAILCSAAEELRQFSFAPTRFEASAAMPADQTFVVASSGVTAEKTGAALLDYNLLGSLGGAAVDAWNRYTGVDARHLGDILSRAPLEDLEAAVRAYASNEYPIERVIARVRQFEAESYRLIPESVAALQEGDVVTFGELVERSQHGAEVGLRNQVPETIHLVRSAKKLGAVAASAFGAGFGGSVWAMVRASDADAFRKEWSAAYLRAFPDPAENARFFEDRPGTGAGQLGTKLATGQVLPVST